MSPGACVTYILICMALIFGGGQNSFIGVYCVILSLALMLGRKKGPNPNFFNCGRGNHDANECKSVDGGNDVENCFHLSSSSA